MRREPVRVRIVFRKDGPMRVTSHLDLFRAWERALRRARVPVVYSAGFNPRPKLQLAAALPLGFVGQSEILDVWLGSQVATEDLEARLKRVLPAGLELITIQPTALKGPALQTQVEAARYRVWVEWPDEAARYRVWVEWPETGSQVAERVQKVLSALEIPHEHRGRVSDLRPLILELVVVSAGEGDVILSMTLAAREGATARPEAVLRALGLEEAFARIWREELIFDDTM